MIANGHMRVLIERYYHELWNSWRYDLIPELLSVDIAFHGSLGVDVSGHGQFRSYMETVRSAFPDFHNHIEETISEADRIAVRLTYTGTHRGNLFGVPATNKRIEYAGLAIFRASGDTIDSGWVLGDTSQLWGQLGAGP